ncbi:MAG: endonuclease V [Candidatus Sericytochromatia bacterium]|nr:endonuclease V [Candidatus Sericytochromatia bacterium]
MDIDLQHAHPFEVSPDEAYRLQRELARKVVRDNRVGVPDVIMGLEVEHVRGEGRVAAAAVSVRWPGLEIVGRSVADRIVRFPDIRDLAAFQELPVLLHVLAEAGPRPDLVLMGAPGRAHPRGLGTASHLGVLLGIPTISCGGKGHLGQHLPVPPEAGARVPLLHRGEVLGDVLRTRPRIAPVVVTPGHGVDTAAALHWVQALLRGHRLPEPNHLATNLLRDARKRLRQIVREGRPSS